VPQAPDTPHFWKASDDAPFQQLHNADGEQHDCLCRSSRGGRGAVWSKKEKHCSWALSAFGNDRPASEEEDSGWNQRLPSSVPSPPRGLCASTPCG
jgi:hypothetical protein